jgi:uncharacterized protein YihD (DUF1040 family)
METLDVRTVVEVGVVAEAMGITELVGLVLELLVEYWSEETEEEVGVDVLGLVGEFEGRMGGLKDVVGKLVVRARKMRRARKGKRKVTN